jgi:hypothetical protein
MGLFTEDTKIKLAPRTAESIAGGQQLMNIAGAGTPSIPTAGTANLTPIQQLIMQRLGPLLQNIQEGGQLAGDQYRKTLAGEYDPRTSPYYESLRGEADYLKRKGTTALRREHELGGTLMDTNAMGLRGDFINRADSALMQELGRLFESERDRQERAAVGIQNVGAQQAGSMAAVGGIAETERSIEQQQADALYQQAIQQIMFPYQYQSQVASMLMNYSPDVLITGGGLSDFGYAAQSIGSAIKSYYESKGGGGFGGGGK